MTLVPLAGLYAVVGLGCVVAWVGLGRRAAAAAQAGRAGAAVDGVLLGLLWPLYGPFLLARLGAVAEAAPEPAPSGREVAFLSALRRARDTALGALLPDEASARALAGRLRVAAGKVAEIDALLAQPAFDEDDARARLDGLRARAASDYAQSTAAMRVSNIRRLRALRHRFATELDEVGELLVQLTTHAEVLRLAGPGGADDNADSRALVRELVSRVEGLDEMLDDDPHMPDARVHGPDSDR
ncbi:hypothetical protein [Haliangium sp.]|uniref:hypothetical protein n=1 Tax=Haliangium sp. TaxID=2663208 RepID=UPI003D0B8DE9